jgi:hypothetical protein
MVRNDVVGAESYRMSAPAYIGLASIPALAAALRNPQLSGLEPPASSALDSQSGQDRLVPMYCVLPTGPEPAAEAVAAAQIIGPIGERLRRLPAAYGEWDEFDADAFFDLHPSHRVHLIQMSERVTSVHLSFFVDLLLPSFRAAVDYFVHCFQPQYMHMQQHLDSRALRRAVLGLSPVEAPSPASIASDIGPGAAIDASPDSVGVEWFFAETQPTMVARWQRLVAVALHTRRLLGNDPAFWSLNAANDERLRRRDAWRLRPAVGLADALLPRLGDVPTLTLSIDFPLPAARQPGRLRRLRRGRTRQAHAMLQRARNNSPLDAAKSRKGGNRDTRQS